MRPRARHRTSSTLFCFALILLFVGVANYWVLIWSQAKIIEHEALRIAEVVTSHALNSRSVYAEEVAEKNRRDGFGPDEQYHQRPGYVPLPAQFLKFVAQSVSRANEGLYRYTPLSKWNLDADQGLQDTFQKWAWQQLEQQDQAQPTGPIDWQPVWQFENKQGVRTLRYVSADAAATASCVACHNALEKKPELIQRRLDAGVKPGKEWQLHQLMGALEVQVPVDKVEALAANQAKTTLWVVLSVSLGGMLTAALLLWRGIHKERAYSAYFAQQSMKDPLTGLLNRTGLEESAQNLLSQCATAEQNACILFLDLDGFKPINDSYGHRVGDKLLQQVASRINHLLDDDDVAARQGGDEFVLVMTNPPSLNSCQQIAQTLLDDLTKPYQVEGHVIRVSASIGISHYPDHGESLGVLVRKADHAMYQAKSKGRATFVVYEDEPT